MHTDAKLPKSSTHVTCRICTDGGSEHVLAVHDTKTGDIFGVHLVDGLNVFDDIVLSDPHCKHGAAVAGQISLSLINAITYTGCDSEAPSFTASARSIDSEGRRAVHSRRRRRRSAMHCCCLWITSAMSTSQAGRTSLCLR